MNNNLNGQIESARSGLVDNMSESATVKPAIGNAALFGNAPAQQVENPIDVLTAQAQLAKEETVSLKTLKKKEVDKIMAAVENGRKIADDYYLSKVEPEIRRREENYEASEEMFRKKFPVLSESSKWRSRDIKTVIDWIMPGLIEAFTGSDDPVDIKGVNVEDDDNAKKIQQLLKYQLERKNSYFSFLKASLHNALKVNLGIAKVHWNRSEKREAYEMMWDLNDYQTFDAINAAVESGKCEISDIKKLDGPNDFYRITFDKIIVSANHPVVESLPPSEFRFTPEATNIQECKFVAHRKVVQGDYLKRKEVEGVYQNVSEALEKSGDTRPTSSEAEKNNELLSVRNKLSDSDLASKSVNLYECYVRVDYNNDGIYENLIVHCVGDTLLSVQKNDFDLVPFFPACGEYDSCMIFPKEGYTDGLEQLQDLKTALVRQVIIAVAKNNIPQKYVNSVVDIDALLAGEEIIVVNDKNNPSDSVYIPQPINISPLTMDLVQYAQNEIESQSGSTKYNQGLDSNSLNKTATGITAIMGAADKRLKLVAKQLAENFIVPMFKYMILLNQRYAEPEQLIRLGNDSVNISRDELDIDYDFIINVGTGAGTKEAQIQYLMILISQIFPALEARGVADANSLYSIAKDLLEKMGLRNTANYAIDPTSEQGMKKQAQMQQAAQQAQQMQVQALEMKQKTDLEKAKLQRVSVPYDSLPQDAKLQLLNFFGINTTPNQIAVQEVINNA